MLPIVRVVDAKVVCRAVPPSTATQSSDDQKLEALRRVGVGLSAGSAADLAGLDAAGAHVEALGRTVDGGAHSLDVRVEATLRDLARPGTVVAEAGLLDADVADGSHRALLG